MNVQGKSDRELLQAYMQGEEQSLTRLIERHGRRVKEYIRMLVKDPALADDLYQETFIKAVREIDAGRYKDTGKFLSWVLRIAHNQVIDHYRRQRQNREVREADAGYSLLNTMQLSDGNMEDALVKRQTESQIRALVERLPEEQREVVQMRYYSGMSFKEIAEQTGVSINTALGRMRYALLNMRKEIREKNLVLG